MGDVLVLLPRRAVKLDAEAQLGRALGRLCLSSNLGHYLGALTKLLYFHRHT